MIADTVMVNGPGSAVVTTARTSENPAMLGGLNDHTAVSAGVCVSNSAQGSLRVRRRKKV